MTGMADDQIRTSKCRLLQRRTSAAIIGNQQQINSIYYRAVVNQWIVENVCRAIYRNDCIDFQKGGRVTGLICHRYYFEKFLGDLLKFQID